MSFCALPGVVNKSEFTSDYLASYPLLFRMSWLYNLTSVSLPLWLYGAWTQVDIAHVTLPDHKK